MLDWSASDVFEFGSGNSSFWWAARARSVTSVKNEPNWHAELISRLPDNAHAILQTERPMQDVLTESDRTYDVIAIDNGSNRIETARAALTRLASGGLIILDNAEWYYQTAAKEISNSRRRIGISRSSHSPR